MNLAIAVPVYNRPSYYGQCVNRLLRTPEAATTPVFVFGDPKAGHRLPECQALTPESWNWVTHAEPKGLAFYKQDALRYLFALGYDAVFAIEDDVLVSKYALTLGLSLYRWAAQRYSNVGAVSLSLVDTFTSHPQAVCDAAVHQCAQLYLRDAFYGSADLINEYEAIVRRMLNVSAMINELRAWFKEKAKAIPPWHTGMFPVRWDYRAWYSTVQPVGTDILLDCALRYQGLGRPTTCASRVQYIGAQGANTNPEIFATSSLSKSQLVEREADQHQTEFFILPA